MFHCAVVNDIVTNPLPPPHPELTKYFDPPKKVLKKAQSAIEECRSVFNVKEGKLYRFHSLKRSFTIIPVPKRVGKAKKDGHVHAQDDDDDMLLLDRKQPSASASRLNIVEDSSGKGKEVVAEDSETEDEDDELLLDHKKPSTPPASSRTREGGPLPTPARSISPHVDPGLAPGRIIGNTYPLKDFRKNLAQGDVVSKAVEDLSAVIGEVVMRPFASRRTREMLDCMIALRNTCLMVWGLVLFFFDLVAAELYLKEDEIAKWNR